MKNHPKIFSNLTSRCKIISVDNAYYSKISIINNTIVSD